MKKVLKKQRRPAVIDRGARRRIAEVLQGVRLLDGHVASLAAQKRGLADKIKTVEGAAERILILRQASVESMEKNLNTRLLHENQSLLEVVSQMRRVLIDHGLLR